MDKTLPLLRVQLFGRETITYDNVPILLSKNSLTKGMKMLLILIYSGKSGISRSNLLEHLFGGEELSDASNSLRVILFRAKKMLTEAGLPEYEYIVSRNGYFYWECPMEMEVDTDVFKKLIKQEKRETNEKKKTELLKRICTIYKGEFLQRLSGDDWVLMESYQYKSLYTESLERVCEYLMEKKEYDEILKLVTPACELYPFDEWQSVRIDCYIAMNRFRDALREYENTAKLLEEELGIEPTQRMQEQYKIMSGHITDRPQIINEIQGSLQEEIYEPGAFFCTYPGFRDTYRLMRRTMERTGQPIFLMVCTLTDTDGQEIEDEDKKEVLSNALHETLRYTLRRCDVFTKYNTSQFLVMLMGTNEANCQVVIDRVCQSFTGGHKSIEGHIQCNVSSLCELDMSLKKTYYKR